LIRRAEQLAWIRHYTLDIDADFRRFYGTTWNEALDEMTGPEFFGLAIRLVHYGGVITHLVQAEVGDEQPMATLDPRDPFFAGIIE
jgi:hypothetical protein